MLQLGEIKTLFAILNTFKAIRSINTFNKIINKQKLLINTFL